MVCASPSCALPKIEAALCALRNFPVIIMRAVGFCCAFESLRAPDARQTGFVLCLVRPSDYVRSRFSCVCVFMRCVCVVCVFRTDEQRAVFGTAAASSAAEQHAFWTSRCTCIIIIYAADALPPLAAARAARRHRRRRRRELIHN